MKENGLFAVTGFIAALVTIIDFVYRFITTSQVQFSLVSIIALCVFVVSVAFYIIFKNPKLKYDFKKHILFYFRSGDSYWVKNKECIYIYKTMTAMEYRKKHTIVSNVNDLNKFSDKFKWSKHQEVSDIHIKCNSNHRTIDVKRDENWHCYTVSFDEIAKKAEKEIDIFIEDLKDENKEALPFLSSNIINRTENLVLEVRFEDVSLRPINIRYQIYDNYASNFPIYEEKLSSARKLSYDVDRNIIRVEEYKPIFGYRYVIKWDFRV